LHISIRDFFASNLKVDNLGFQLSANILFNISKHTITYVY